MKTTVLCLIASATTLCAPMAYAQSDQADTVATCTAALAAGDNDAASAVAETLKSWRFLTRSELVAPAAICLTQTSGEPWDYDRTAGRFRPTSEFVIDPEEKQKADVERRRAADEAAKLKQQEAVALAKLNAKSIAEAEARKAVNDRKVRIGVMTACRNLWKTAPDAAFLNHICVESFFRDGMPKG